MAPKTVKVYTLDELKEKEKCREVLDDPKLVQILKTAPLNKDGKVNLSFVYREAEKYVHEQTKDLKKTKELAVAARFLAMLRRDFPEEFEKLISQKEQSMEEVKIEVQRKLFHEIEFRLTHGTFAGMELTTRESVWGNVWVERFIRFKCDSKNDYLSPRLLGREFCMEILNALIETADPPGDMDLMRDLIQLFEEKFGLKTVNKLCANCEAYAGNKPRPQNTTTMWCTGESAELTGCSGHKEKPSSA